jgi:dTDP-4-amino-4,6-dideoxygalactose transaminase
MADLNAAVARAQLGRMQELLERRHTIAARYLSELGEFAPAPFHPDHSYYRVIVRVDGRAAAVADELRRGGIDARASVNPWLDERLDERRREFRGAEVWRTSLLSLPIHPRLEERDVERVIGATQRAIEVAGRARSR